MTGVFGLDGKPIAQVTPSERSADAREALRALLARLDAGEVQAEAWLFIYQKLNPDRPDVVATASLDSDLTLSDACHLMENLKFDLMLLSRETRK